MLERKYAMNDGVVKSQVLQTRHLPPLSVTATRLLQCVGNPNVEIVDLDRIIGQDPGLSARILGLANAAYFAQTRPILTVSDAIIRVLGLSVVKSLALTITLAGAFDASRCRGFDLNRYWRAALGTAELGRLLAREAGNRGAQEADAAYLAGLMKDLGLLVLAHAFPDQMAQVFAVLERESEAGPLDVEAHLVGINHCQAGAWLAQRWHLPQPVIRVMAHYRNRDYRGEFEQQALLVGAAARYLDNLIEGASPALDRDLVLRERLGLGTVALERVQRRFHATFDELSALAAALV